MNIGLDVGCSAVKAVSGDRRVPFPSVVGTPDKARFSLDGAGRNDIILAQPSQVLVGEGAVLQSRHLKRREDRGWIGSEEWYYLFLSAISELTTATQVDLRIVTELPVSFYTDKDGVRERLLGEHRVQPEGHSAQSLQVTDCQVIPQPFGSLLSLALDNQGRIADNGLATGVVGVIDIGVKTTNLLSVNRLSETSRETSSVSVGVWSVARAVRAYIADHCPELELRGHQILDAIKNREVRYFGELIDLQAVIELALASLAEQVIAEATQLWNGAAGLDVILVSGGGALLLGPAIKSHFRHVRIVSEPVFANAFGFWRFTQRLGKGCAQSA